MMYRLLFLILLLPCSLYGQNFIDLKTSLTHQDTLRGSITSERAWWDVLRYDLFIQPHIEEQTLHGMNDITYRLTADNNDTKMQIDLQPPMHIDSVLLDGIVKVSYTHDGNAWYMQLPKQYKGEIHTMKVYYSGKPLVAASPPGDGGFTWEKDDLGRSWVATSCQGIGASVWYPCKDHQSDEPDRGASITIIVPDTLVAVSNGRLISKVPYMSNTIYKWQVVSPINNYGIGLYIGNYVEIKDTYYGEEGGLDMSFWVLDYNRQKATEHLIFNTKKTLANHEKWMGPYPFYADGIKMVDAPYIGMEHQSAIAYGNRYQYGYRGKDISKTGYGMEYDILIVHELAHEWFGNSITTADLADKWVHEGFAGYVEILYLNDNVSIGAANEYLVAKRAYIKNETPIIPRYGINEMNGADDYSKGRAVVHMIRQVVNDDDNFRQLLRDMNKDFYHSVTSSAELERYIITKTGIDFSIFFDQYLRTSSLPVFEYTIKNGVLKYRYANCVKGFDMPLVIFTDKKLWIKPTTQWQKMNIAVDTLEVAPDFYVLTKKI